MIEKTLDELKKRGRDIYLLAHSAALLGWDQETYIPERAVAERSEQLALLEGILHEKLTHPRMGELLEALGASPENPRGKADLSDRDGGYVRLLYRMYRRATCFPEELVKEFARRTSIGQAVWARARREKDFSLFAPELEKILELVKERSRLLGVGEHPYDALIDEYEPGMTKAELDRIFITLKRELVELSAWIARQPQVDNGFISRKYPQADQEDLGRFILAELSYPMDRGRLDISTHPFTTTLGSHDVRITTRYGEKNPFNSFYSTIHEAGHGLYELGFGEEISGNLLAEGTSLGIHESQSRTWENLVGRSRKFWRRYFPEVKKRFHQALGDVTEETFFRGMNRVEPSFIRVDADEVTYGLHVIFRYELEVALIEGSLRVDELPQAWNDKMVSCLGICPPDAAQGVLQDVHWSAGLMGYFPTYALGNLYGAQLMNAASRELPNLDEDIEAGRLAVLLDWLRKKIHRHGSVYTASELMKQVTGESLTSSYFIDYLKKKYRDIYGGVPL